MPRRSQLDRLDDDALIAMCNDGDAADAARAFETLYLRHKDYVVRVAMRYVPSHDLALDVLQETFGYLLRRFRPEGGGFELTARLTTYLYPVAKNYAITQLRKASRLESDDEPDDLAAEAREPVDDLDRILARLPDPQREVLVLRFVDGFSLADIADALGIPLGTVKSRLHTAIRELRNSPEIRKLYFP